MLKLAFTASALCLLATGVAAAAEARLDLVCTGERRDAPGGPAAPYSTRYRLDLDASRWCRDGCEQPASMTVTADRITFEERRAQAGNNRTVLHYISRSTGELVDVDIRPGSHYLSVSGRCAPAPFTGITAPRF